MLLRGIETAQAEQAAEKSVRASPAMLDPAFFSGSRCSPEDSGLLLFAFPLPLLFLRVGFRDQAGLGSNFTKRIMLQAAAPRQNAQCTRRRPRNLVCQNPATDLIHPKSFSINFRFI